MLAAEQASHPAVNELIKPDSLAAGRVKCFACRSAGRLGDDGAKVGLLDKRVHVDTPDNAVDVHAIDHSAYVDAPQDVIDVRSLKQGVNVHPVQQGVHVHLLQDLVGVDVTQRSVQVDTRYERIDIQRVNEEIDHALRDPLGDRLHRVGDSLTYRPQPVARIHATQYRHGVIPEIIHRG